MAEGAVFMAVQGYLHENGTFEVFCALCGAFMGVLSREETSALSKLGAEEICFECEGESCDVVPGVLLSGWDDGWQIDSSKIFWLRPSATLSEKGLIVHIVG